MSALHTPGPWLTQWGAAQGGDGHHIIDTKDMGELSRIAVVLFHDDAEGETASNARLIAAAPELLEALIAITNQLERVGDDRPHKDGQFIEDARAAIAKATGEAA